MPLPPLLGQLMSTKRWRQPRDRIIIAAIPFLQGPVDFLLSEEEMRHESCGFGVGYPHMRQYRGSQSEPRSLPWLDVELSLSIAVNRVIGDDLVIALDYRSSETDPKVVASDWWTGDRTLHWREAFPTFSAFVKAVRL